MNWPAPLLEARFLKRYKRFFADFALPDGRVVTAHCANTGSMKTCMLEGAPSWLTHHGDPRRKLAYSWQAVRMPDGWVGINTALANTLVVEAIQNGTVSQLQGFHELQTEQKYGTRSRVDILLKGGGPDCYVEVKNVTLQLDPGLAGFPDAVTERGTKHVRELCAMLEAGHRAVLFFCVQRASARKVAPADRFDPVYGAALREAVAKGLEVYAYRADFQKEGIALRAPLAIEL